MDIEFISCNICGTSQYEEKYYPINSGYLVRCRKCDLYYANPRRKDIINNILSGNIPTELYESKKLNFKGRIIEFNRYLEMIHKYKQPPGRLLDIGCYEGYFLYEARKYGWECYGVEPDVGGTRYANEWLKLDVKKCVLEKACFDDKSFDIVTMLATLEHIPDPLGTLKEVRRIMKDEGILVVVVPTVPFYLPLIRTKWRMFIGDHYWFFTDVSMTNLMNKAGFKIISNCYVPKSVDLDTITYRLAEEWQPYNLGKVGRFIRKAIMSFGLTKIRFTLNLFDTKIYIVRSR